ncbi:PREDICTED: receptor-like protein 12 [Ipomoea nil]|uniref:receptor-like protein 12 n=1 Tax=Ipomoea nil TaxID=35883 RepID=UPI000900C853|nr:PREDICTED: receptor-like protein 12 [Ipomoea nil]
MNIYVDATVFGDTDEAYFGVFVVDSNGEFVAAKNGPIRCLSDVHLAEALAVKEALSWVKELGLTKDLSYAGCVIRECRSFQRHFDLVSFHYVSRSVNRFAHALARATRSQTDTKGNHLQFFCIHQAASLNGNKLSGHINELRNVTSPLESLDLSRNNLEGTIPLFFFHLHNLTSLDLSSNNFFGQMIDLQNVTSPLELLDLSYNNLEGTIPLFFFQLQNLTSINLSSNKFFGQMIDLQNVTSPLQYLHLSSNDFEGTIPPFLFQLQNLTMLDLSSNKFNGIVHLTKFKNQYIDILDFSNNNLVIETAISTSQFPLLPQFGELNLASCNLQKIPDFLKSQSRLWWLDLSNNSISGEIPNWIWGIGNGQLYGLNLSHNRLTHMKEPIEYGSLTVLDLNSNMLSGQIPRPPPEAMYLDFSNNNFSIIPLDIADQIPYLFVFFSIAKNRVSGKISTSWCRAANLIVLDLSHNALHGTIPSCLAQNNSNLVVLNLRGNHLSGEISQKFQHTCSLETLDLSQNLLEGKVPPSLINCTKLKILNLGNNKISDTFPCWLNKLSNLHILVLHSNHFHGSISCPMLGVNNSWPSLQVIDLSSNNFNGHLPTDLFLALKAILVERNELNSKVDYLHFTSQGVSIYYQDSVILSLKGQIYTIQKILSIFTSIDFSSNQFEGSIPESVGELKQLYLLNISHNALTGDIPPSLENLKALEALDLSFNNLAGNIPEQLDSLTFLEILNLSYNHLVGRIPKGRQFNTFDASSFMGNKELCGFQLNVSCTGINEPTSPIPEPEEKQSSHHVDIYISVALGFVAGLGGTFLPLLLSSKWRSYYNKKIDEILSKIFF